MKTNEGERLVRKTHPPSCFECKVAGKVPCIQNKMADVFFVQVAHLHLFSCKLSSFSFADRQNAYSCKSDLFTN